jgi:hypothetical protein
MADKMHLVITLRKEVPDREAGHALFYLIREQMRSQPNHGICL